MSSHIVQDSITFQLRSDTVVVSDTVKISVVINALVTTETTESVLRSDIKKALSRFIEAEWQFNGVERSSDESGFERVSMRATARVKETENYNLENRARAVSRQGLQLANITVDTSVPPAMLEKAEKELRADILKKAGEELRDIITITGRDYRLSALNFANMGDPYARKGPPGGAQAFTASNATYGSGFADGPEESLSNAQKLSLNASVTYSTCVFGT